MQFKKAQRQQARLRLALAGPSGSGKTYGALLVAKGIGGRIAVIDTEQGSASLYDHLTDFDTLTLDPPYTPERYIAAIQAAVKGGYNVLIIDSMTHEWDGAGGCLEANETLAHARMKGNTWAAWNETTPRHRAFVDCILQSPIHIICTMRSKTETVQGDGKKVMKLGMKTVQRDGTDYEFTTVLDLTHDNHYANASKDRTGLFSQPEILSEATGKRVLAWLNSGAAPAPSSPPVPPPPPTAPVDDTVYKTLCSTLAAVKTQVDLDTAGKMIAEQKAAGKLTPEMLNTLTGYFKAARNNIPKAPPPPPPAPPVDHPQSPRAADAAKPGPWEEGYVPDPEQAAGQDAEF